MFEKIKTIINAVVDAVASFFENVQKDPVNEIIKLAKVVTVVAMGWSVVATMFSAPLGAIILMYLYAVGYGCFCKYVIPEIKGAVAL